MGSGDKLNELLSSIQKEKAQTEEQPKQDVLSNLIMAQQSNGENIIVPQPQEQQPYEVQLSLFGKFKALIKRNKIANGIFFFVFTVIVMVILVLLARLFHIKLG